MKTTEIKPWTEYAMGPPQAEPGSGRICRCVVIGVGYRWLGSAWTRSREIVKDDNSAGLGVVRELVSGDWYPDVVQPQSILRTWEEELVLRQKRAVREGEARARLVAEQARREALVERLSAKLPKSVLLQFSPRDGGLILSGDEQAMIDLLERLAETP